MTQAAQLIENSEPWSSVEIALLPSGNYRVLSRIWERIEHHLVPALELVRGQISFDDIKKLHVESRVQIWIVKTLEDPVAGVVVTEIYTPIGGKRSLRVLVGGGKGILDEARDPLLEVLESAAREAGCQSIIIEGRKGWEAVLPDFRFAAIVLEKELTQ